MRPVRRHHQLRAHHRRQRAGDDAGEEDRGGELDRELAEQRPVLPVMKASGTNTAISVQVVAMTAKPISRAPSKEASSGGSPCSMRRWMFSISTIASSTTMPMASTIGEQGQDVDRGAEERHHHEGGDDRDRDRDHGDDGRAPVAQEDQDHEDDEADALDERLQHAVDRGADELALVVHDVRFGAGRQGALELLELGRGRRRRRSACSRSTGARCRGRARCCRPCRTRSGRPRAPTSTLATSPRRTR